MNAWQLDRSRNSVDWKRMTVDTGGYKILDGACTRLRGTRALKRIKNNNQH
jgi:hypothetical protein